MESLLAINCEQRADNAYSIRKAQTALSAQMQDLSLQMLELELDLGFRSYRNARLRQPHEQNRKIFPDHVRSCCSRTNRTTKSWYREKFQNNPTLFNETLDVDYTGSSRAPQDILGSDLLSGEIDQRYPYKIVGCEFQKSIWYHHSVFGFIVVSSSRLRAKRSTAAPTMFRSKSTIVIQLAPWLLSVGFQIDVVFQQSPWVLSPTISVFAIVPKTAAVFQAIRDGDFQSLRHLFQYGLASPSDRDPDGLSCLHVNNAIYPLFNFLLI